MGWWTGRTRFCGWPKHMLFQLACMAVRSGALVTEEGSGGGLSLADWSSLLFEACPGRGAYFLQLVCAEGVWSGASPVLLVSGSSAVL